MLSILHDWRSAPLAPDKRQWKIKSALSDRVHRKRVEQPHQPDEERPPAIGEWHAAVSQICIPVFGSAQLLGLHIGIVERQRNADSDAREPSGIDGLSM
jgi:hypothetical protein